VFVKRWDKKSERGRRTLLVVEVSGSVGGTDEGVVDAEGAQVEAELLLALVVEALGVVDRPLGAVGVLEGHVGHLHGGFGHNAVGHHSAVGLLHFHSEVQIAEALLRDPTNQQML
jgi:hypothetical protein